MRPYRTASMGGLCTLLAAARRNSRIPEYHRTASRDVVAITREIARRQGERA